MNFNHYIFSGKLMCQMLHLIWWHSWMPAGKIQTMNMGNQHLVQRHGIVRLKCDGTRAESRFCLSPKRMSPLKSVGTSVQQTAGSQVVCISGSNAGYTMFRGSVRVLATHSICQFPLYFPFCASPCAIRFQTHSTIFPTPNRQNTPPPPHTHKHIKYKNEIQIQ
jgi:hypothetical protein